MYYKKIDKDLYNINIEILNSYKIKMELLKENRENKIKNNEGDIDFLEYSLKMINLDLIPYKRGWFIQLLFLCINILILVNNLCINL